ncbi:hypothetical protein WSM22_03990 [Cytophagales bacterium WSM2-2]|nr:hypothetical protein WSM22_03990 [Cytophagales bacterium WSM2-2]
MKEQLLKTLENSRAYTLAVAEGMPEKNYSFKPIESVWNFGELLNHIAYGIEWWTANNIKKTKVDWNPPANKEGKKQIVEYLNSAYDTLKATVHKEDVNEVIILGFSSTIDHITHHRGQAITYLRCQGVSAPEYTY